MSAFSIVYQIFLSEIMNQLVYNYNFCVLSGDSLSISQLHIYIPTGSLKITRLFSTNNVTLLVYLLLGISRLFWQLRCCILYFLKLIEVSFARIDKKTIAVIHSGNYTIILKPLISTFNHHSYQDKKTFSMNEILNFNNIQLWN